MSVDRHGVLFFFLQSQHNCFVVFLGDGDACFVLGVRMLCSI